MSQAQKTYVDERQDWTSSLLANIQTHLNYCVRRKEKQEIGLTTYCRWHYSPSHYSPIFCFAIADDRALTSPIRQPMVKTDCSHVGESKTLYTTVRVGACKTM